MNIKYTRAILEKAGVSFESGLTDAEIGRVEHHFGFIFPDDLREFLSFALPAGSQFPNWRDLDSPALKDRLSWPLDGIWFDIQNNSFWPIDWGEKPLDESEALRQLRTRISQAPRLIPICGHRYMPDRPSAAGNPVFSVYQSDIIYYGSDLENYLSNEYHYYFGTPKYSLGKQIRSIEFWMDLVG